MKHEKNESEVVQCSLPPSITETGLLRISSNLQICNLQFKSTSRVLFYLEWRATHLSSLDVIKFNDFKILGPTKDKMRTFRPWASLLEGGGFTVRDCVQYLSQVDSFQQLYFQIFPTCISTNLSAVKFEAWTHWQYLKPHMNNNRGLCFRLCDLFVLLRFFTAAKKVFMKTLKNNTINYWRRVSEILFVCMLGLHHKYITFVNLSMHRMM